MNYNNRHEFLADIIQSAGIKVSLRGYTYIKHAVLYVAENPDLPYKYMNVYKKIGEKFNVKSASVDRATRHAINNAYDKHLEQLKAFFPYPVDRPSNSEFISLAADRFVNRIMKPEHITI